MKKYRRFSTEFKRQVVEEMLGQTVSQAQICRRYNISSGLLYHWKKQYARGRFGNEPTETAALTDSVNELERMVGKLTMENAFLKKALQKTLEQAEKKESSLPSIEPIFQASKRGVKS